MQWKKQERCPIVGLALNIFCSASCEKWIQTPVASFATIGSIARRSCAECKAGRYRTDVSPCVRFGAWPHGTAEFHGTSAVRTLPVCGLVAGTGSADFPA